MPQYTTNLNLIKPLGSETADISKINDNMDTIDTKIGGVSMGTTAVTLTGAIAEKAQKSEAVKNITRNNLTFTATRCDGTTFTFTQKDTTYSEATSSAYGLVKIGYTASGKNYPVQLSSGKMYVNVPWTDHYAWSDITGKPANYPGGCTGNAATASSVPWSGITSKPTFAGGTTSLAYNANRQIATVAGSAVVVGLPPAVNGLTSTDTVTPLSAAMGKKLQDEKAAKQPLDYYTLLDSTVPTTNRTYVTTYSNRLLKDYNILSFGVYTNGYFRNSIIVPYSLFRGNKVSLLFRTSGTEYYVDIEYFSDGAVMVTSEYANVRVLCQGLYCL